MCVPYSIWVVMATDLSIGIKNYIWHLYREKHKPKRPKSTKMGINYRLHDKKSWCGIFDPATASRPVWTAVTYMDTVGPAVWFGAVAEPRNYSNQLLTGHPVGRLLVSLSVCLSVCMRLSLYRCIGVGTVLLRANEFGLTTVSPTPPHRCRPPRLKEHSHQSSHLARATGYIFC